MLRASAIAILLLIPSHPAHSFPIDCGQVRAFVAERGKAAAIAFAISNGATLAQIREAKKCLQTVRPPDSSYSSSVALSR